MRRENNGFYRGAFVKSELEIIFLPRYKNKPQGSSDGVLGFNTFFDSFYIVLASPIHSGMVTIEIKLTIATV